MKNQTSLRMARFLALVFVLAVFSGPLALAANEAPGVKHADVVTIDAMAEDGKLEFPAVTFLHDQHTKALAALNKDCSACHKPLKEGGKDLSFTFMGGEALKGEALKSLYHTSCIGCHAQMSKAGQKTGPLEAECRTCHSADPVESDWQAINLDKAVHYNHVASKQISVPGNDKNCAACHHTYDAAQKKLVWTKDKEDSCAACHMLPELKAAMLKMNKDAADENGQLAKRPSLDVAAHQMCVNCHLKISTAVPAVKYGPFDCYGCHSPLAQEALAEQEVKEKTPVPRLERGQADAYLMLPKPEKAKELKGMMSPVSFNHKYHESVSKDCRSCHHKKIANCASCHSYEGKAEGAFISFSQAMHKPEAGRSCVGCHNVQKQSPSCAGCHTRPQLSLLKTDCATCHRPPAGMDEAKAEDGSLLGLNEDAARALALSAVSARGKATAGVYEQNDIPEKVTINILSKEYKPVELPHRKIVNTLLEKQKDNRLAAAFHTDKSSLCQGCHHKSPPSKTPPKCVSCHSSVDVATPGSLPPLKTAYHQQCMTCHARMNQKPAETECADCHKPIGQ